MPASTSASPLRRTVSGLMSQTMLFMAVPGMPENSTASLTSLVVSTGTFAWMRLALVRMLLFSTKLPSKS